MSIFSWSGATAIASTARASPDGRRTSATSATRASAATHTPRPRCQDATCPRSRALNPTVPPSCPALSPLRALAAHIGVEQRVKQMVLPDAVNSQIAARQAFALESRLLEKLDRGRIGRKAGRLEPVQLERVEDERNDGADAGGHIALVGVVRADPIAERAGLRDT